MNARRNHRRAVKKDKAADRSTRTVTLVWGQKPGKGVRANWLIDSNSQQDVLRGKQNNAIAS